MGVGVVGSTVEMGGGGVSGMGAGGSFLGEIRGVMGERGASFGPVGAQVLQVCNYQKFSLCDLI